MVNGTDITEDEFIYLTTVNWIARHIEHIARYRGPLCVRGPMQWEGLAVILAVLAWCPLGGAVRFMLDSANEHYTPRGRCVLYKIPGHSLVTGEVSGIPPPNGRIGVYAYDPQGNQPFSRPELNGKASFSFRSADVPTEYELCFRMNSRSGYGPVPGNPIVPVEITLNYTFDLFDDQKANDLKVKPMEAEFARLEETMRSVVSEANNFLKVEKSMRDTNENTFNLLKYLSGLSVLAFVGLNVYQVYYMKRYFKAKKLI